MRLFYIFLTFVTTIVAFEIPFLSALSLPITIEDYFPSSFATNATASEEDEPKKYLRSRQVVNGCPNNFHACTDLGQPGLCCADAAVCQPDDRGNVACCPSNSVCSGVVNGAIRSGTVNSIGSVVGGGGGQPTNTSPRPIGSNSAGVVVQSNQPTTTLPSGSAFVLNGGNGDNGAGLTRGEIPLLARAILRVLRYFAAI